MHVDLIKLYGSMELAPLCGLADVIVDLISTGNTLKANDLVAVEDIMPIIVAPDRQSGGAEAEARPRAAAARGAREGGGGAEASMTAMSPLTLRRLDSAAPGSTRARRADRVRGRAGSRDRRDGGARSSPTCARAATRRCSTTRRSSTGCRRPRSRRSRFPPQNCAQAFDALPADAARGARDRRGARPRVPRAAEDAVVDLPRRRPDASSGSR